MFVFHFSFVNRHSSYVQPAYYNLGVVYSEMMQYDTALSCYEKAAIERPMYAEAYCNMGVIYKNRGDLESAIACYERFATYLTFLLGPACTFNAALPLLMVDVVLSGV